MRNKKVVSRLLPDSNNSNRKKKNKDKRIDNNKNKSKIENQPQQEEQKRDGESIRRRRFTESKRSLPHTCLLELLYHERVVADEVVTILDIGIVVARRSASPAFGDHSLYMEDRLSTGGVGVNGRSFANRILSIFYEPK